jgi:hypothetical protein
MASLADNSRQSFAGRTEETLFGFSLRELSAPDPGSRIRAAERLRALASSAAAPALATALHSEQVPEVLVALLHAFSPVTGVEGVAVIAPHLESNHPDVRISALKSLLAIDPTRAAPHLSAAMRDPDRAVRRRASLLALSLDAATALRLGEDAVRDQDADVRAVGALALGATSGDRARNLLLDALKDREEKVRSAAARSLSRLLGVDVSPVVHMGDAQRIREVRRLATLPIAPAAANPAGAHESVTVPAAVALSAGGPSAAAPVGLAIVSVPGRRASGGAPGVGPAAVSVPGRMTSDAATAAMGELAFVAPRAAGGAARVESFQAASAPAAPSSAVRIARAAEAQSNAHPMASTTVAVSADVCEALVSEVRCAIRGRTFEDLVSAMGAAPALVERACAVLVEQGQLVRRGLKYFVA